MKTIVLDLDHLKRIDDLSLTIGNFDGLHLGHQELIKNLDDKRKKAVMTFFPHPKSFFTDQKFLELTPIKEKKKLLKENKIDYLLLFPFDEKSRYMTKEGFVELLKVIGVHDLVLGKDFHFGHNQEGNLALLKENFLVKEISPIKKNNVRISSTLIKNLLECGQIKEANDLLDYPYTISGFVCKGDGIGSKIGFPTANINVKGFFMPKEGVYSVKVFYAGNNYEGVINIGHNPSLNFHKKLRVEVFIKSFHSQIYHKQVRISFLRYLRPEKKFASEEELINQIKSDLLS